MNSENITVFTPAPHHDVLALIMQIAVLLFTARAFGELAQRLRLPSVVGEILSGILLGPSILSGLFPDTIGIIVPQNETQGHLLELISLIGAMFLLLITGLETDLKLIRHQARSALGAALGGIVVPFLTGFLLGQLIPDYLLAAPQKRLIFSLFIATAMSISAIPVLAKVLIDMKLTRRDIGQSMIAAGMIDDTIGWTLLSIVAGLAAGETVSTHSVLTSIGTVVGFFLFSFTFGLWLVRRVFNFVQDKTTSRDRLLTLVVVMTFLWGSLTHFLHLEAVIGAFVMGILFAQVPRLPNAVHHKLESVALGIFAPIFFATAGLKVNIQSLMRPDLIGFTFLVILVASLGKVIGAYWGSRVIGRKDHWTALSFGAALNARGAMEIIVATIGLSLGILSQEMFSIIVVMAMVTSLLTPFALRWVLTRVPVSEEEKKRLKQENLDEGSPIVNIHRVLMPLRQRKKDDIHLQAMQITKSKILHNIGLRNKLSITLLNVEAKKQEQEHTKFLEITSHIFREHELINKTVYNKNVVEEILLESRKEYELLVLGASRQTEKSKFVFSKVIDNLIRLAPCPTMIVHAPEIKEDWSPNRILVPSNGSSAAHNAVELAFMIASTGNERVKVLNIIEKENDDLYQHLDDEGFRRRLKVAADMLKPFKEMGDLKGVPTEIDAKVSPSPEKTIVDFSVEDNIDLIIIGTNVRPASEHLFLGPLTEYVLRNAPCPVITLNSIQ